MAANGSSLSPTAEKDTRRFVVNVVSKALLLFLAFNLFFVLLQPLPWLGQVNAYNALFPGRPRLPFGESPETAYNLSLLQLEAMFGSHVLAGRTKPADEFRVYLLGDSNTWGFLLENDETLAAYLNQQNLQAPDGRRLRFYNLGYPTISLTKDLLVLDQASVFEPDMVVWLVTLEAFPREKQLFTPLVQNNPEPVRRLIEAYRLALDPQDPAFVEPGFWGQTVVGQRRTLADLIRYQLYGVLWAATGIDQDIPETYAPLQQDLSDEVEYYGQNPPDLEDGFLALEVLQAGMQLMGERPVLLVNEPMYISSGENSDIRYNFYYPRWAYDQYRQILLEESQTQGWYYLDAWDVIDPASFTNSAIHLNAAGTRQLAQIIGEQVLDVLEREANP